jgi:hypothetical protein
MFSEVRSPTGHFTLAPIPATYFGTPSPFGSGGFLVLNKFDNNSSVLLRQHRLGIQIAAAQGTGHVSCCEVYGITDRAGSESLNLALSTRRARGALTALTAALGFRSHNIVYSKGIGERFMAEYYGAADRTRDTNFRGVACYLWESFDTATDAFLRVNIAFAGPPGGGAGSVSSYLAPLHMGRLRTMPLSPFA